MIEMLTIQVGGNERDDEGQSVRWVVGLVGGYVIGDEICQPRVWTVDLPAW